MKRLIAIAALMFACVGLADTAHALRDKHVKRYATEAVLLAANEADGVVAYALDTDKHFFRQGSAWVTAVDRAVALTPTDNVSLTADDCGKTVFVTATMDTKTITLPATASGCSYTFIYTGADGGALVDISPAAADAVHGSCTLAASVLEFNGTDDNDVGLTKATANTGDGLTVVGDGSAGWFVLGCVGIWANN